MYHSLILILLANLLCNYCECYSEKNDDYGQRAWLTFDVDYEQSGIDFKNVAEKVSSFLRGINGSEIAAKDELQFRMNWFYYTNDSDARFKSLLEVLRGKLCDFAPFQLATGVLLDYSLHSIALQQDRDSPMRTVSVTIESEDLFVRIAEIGRRHGLSKRDTKTENYGRVIFASVPKASPNIPNVSDRIISHIKFGPKMSIKVCDNHDDPLTCRIIAASEISCKNVPKCVNK